MQTHAQAVVIGGGLIGCSILYHLAKLGWTDVVLCERDELTSGSTWHAAAGIHGLHDVSNISRLQYYTMQLYEELEKTTGQSCGIHKHGYVYLATAKNRLHQLRIQAAKARYYGIEFHEIGLEELRELHPLMHVDDVICAMYEPDSGHVDPSGVTHAYAAGARQLGAKVHRFTRVLETNPRPDGGWDVVTDQGTIHAEHVVNAAGLWGREVARLAGFELPLSIMEHQYFVTESIPEIEALDRELPSVADRDGEYYLRQEGKGLLVGAYERDGRFWSVDEMPADFGHELLPDDLDRISDNVLRACHRLPVLNDAGIKRVINGPMIWAPDAAALLGPVPELRNYWVCNGIIPGFSQSGGLGLTVAQWMVEGEPELDLFPWDVARFGEWADRSYTMARALDSYSHRFRIHFPYEEREAGRPVRTRPAYERQKSLGAVFGLSFGWEHPLWYAPEGVEPVDDASFDRAAWFEPVMAECRALRASLGVIDISNFAKYEVSGAGAGAWLDRVIANHVPKTVGRTCLTPLLGVRGGIAGDFTVTRLGEDRFFVAGSGVAERYHKRFFDKVERPETVEFRSLSAAYAGFNVAGPNARALMEALTGEALSNEAFPFMRSRRMTVAGVETIVLRISFTGDLGYEIYCPADGQLALYEAILEHGAAFDIKPVGSRALLSLRLEKGYGSWGREYSPEYWPQEVGLERLIKTEKPEFLGREAYLRISNNPPRERLCIFSVETDGADPVGGEPIFALDGTPAGRVSSGGFSVTAGASVALGFVKSEFHEPGREFDIAILGEPHRARLLDAPPFDPRGERLRG